MACCIAHWCFFSAHDSFYYDHIVVFKAHVLWDIAHSRHLCVKGIAVLSWARRRNHCWTEIYFYLYRYGICRETNPPTQCYALEAPKQLTNRWETKHECGVFRPITLKPFDCNSFRFVVVGVCCNIDALIPDVLLIKNRNKNAANVIKIK